MCLTDCPCVCVFLCVLQTNLFVVAKKCLCWLSFVADFNDLFFNSCSFALVDDDDDDNDDDDDDDEVIAADSDVVCLIFSL